MAWSKPADGSGRGWSGSRDPTENSRITRFFAALITALAREKCEFLRIGGPNGAPSPST